MERDQCYLSAVERREFRSIARRAATTDALGLRDLATASSARWRWRLLRLWLSVGMTSTSAIGIAACRDMLDRSG